MRNLSFSRINSVFVVLRERILVTVAFTSIALASCGGGGGGGGGGVAPGGANVDPSFNFPKSGFNDAVLSSARAKTGSIDAGFDIGVGFNTAVGAIAQASDGSGDVYVGGQFTNFDGTGSLNRILRLNSDGTVDTGFDIGTGFNNLVEVISPAMDGSGDIYVGGSFSTFAGPFANAIIRLNADGSRDTGFDIGTGFSNSGFTTTVEAISPASDSSGDIFVGGAFTAYDGASSNNIIRLNADGTVDTGFAIGAGFNNDVRAIAPAPDGSGDICVGGTFLSYDGTNTNRFIRLNADGTIDADFDTGAGFNSNVSTIAPTTDGSGDVFVGGDFSAYDGTASGRLVRLNADGTMDAGFASGAGFDSSVLTLAPATDGSGDLYVGGFFTNYAGTSSNRMVRIDATDSGDVYVGGNFTSYAGTSTNRIVRLNADGTVDSGFVTGFGFNSAVLTIAPAMDGSGDLYVGGAFTSYNGMLANEIVRLNADGTVDPGFAIGAGFNSIVSTIAVVPDNSGDLYVGGVFTTFDGVGSNFIIRLNANGTADTGFNVGTGFDNSVLTIAPVPDNSGDLYVGGTFSTYNGIGSNRIIRLNSDGSADAGFGIGAGFNITVEALAPAADGSGDLYVGGVFTTYDGTVSNRIIRLNANGTADTGFAIGTGFDSSLLAIAPVLDGSGDIYVGGNFTTYNGTNSNRFIRLNADGTVDAGFDVGAGFNNRARTLAPATDGSGDLYVGGSFASYDGKGANRFILLKADGAVDAGFTVGAGFDLSVFAIAPATDGSGDIYFGGDFRSYDGTTSGNFIRVNADGTVEASFVVGAGFSSEVNAIAPASDGSGDIYLGGDFATYDGQASSRIIRLNEDGTIDTGFAVGTGFIANVETVATATDGSGDIYVGGDFTFYQGTSSNRIIRLNSDGTIDTGFVVGSGFNTTVRIIAPVPDGSGDIYVGGSFTTYDGTASDRIIRLNANGTIDAGFDVGAGFNNNVQTLALATDGSGDVYVSGDFTTYDGTASIRIIRLNANGMIDTGFAVGAGFNGRANALAPAPDGTGDIYAGGNFTTYDGMTSIHTIRLNADGTIDTNFAVGAFDNFVLAIAPATDGSEDLYVGGFFSRFDGTQVDFAAALNPDGTLD